MQKEELELFKDKQVIIRLDEGFRLTGVIEKIFDESILFSTKTKTSLIDLSIVKGVILEEGYNEL